MAEDWYVVCYKYDGCIGCTASVGANKEYANKMARYYRGTKTYKSVKVLDRERFVSEIDRCKEERLINERMLEGALVSAAIGGLHCNHLPDCREGVV